MKKIRLFVIPLLLWVWISFAHQPRLIFKQPIGYITQIQNPEVSQAFYGILSGQEDIYKIIAKTGFLLYVNLVVPNISGSRKDFSVDIIEGDSIEYTRLEGKWFIWTDFFEPYGGDEYFQWPTREKQVDPGVYTIRVSSPNNQWKYSLAIGKRESFPIKEIINTYKVMPQLKIVFFEKPWYMLFRNVVWWFFIWAIIIMIWMVWGGIYRVKYTINKKKSIWH